MSFIFEDWGLIPYVEAQEKQLKYLEQVSSEDSAGYIIFCTHPPVVTLGRGTLEGDITSWTGELVEVSRGGRATYHGPSQLVVYPIINLKKATKFRKEREVVGFLRNLEGAIVNTLAEFEIKAEGRSMQKKSQEDSAADETGVWFQDRKLASLGIAVKKWITYHGAAINLTKDSTAFTGIKPCGFLKDISITLEEINPQIDLQKFKSQLLQNLQTYL